MVQFERKKKEDIPVLAICYDFDKTLSPDDMQAQGYIQSVRYQVDKFWEKSGTGERDGFQSGLYVSDEAGVRGHVAVYKRKIRGVRFQSGAVSRRCRLV